MKTERHSMTTTYIHKLNLGVNVAYNMRHALTWFAQTWRNLTLVLENSWNLKKSAFCPGIVLGFCKIILENIKLVFEKYKNTTSVFRLMGCTKKLCENRKLLSENR